MILTPEYLAELGYKSKIPNNPFYKVYFSEDRESWLTVDFKTDFVSVNKFINDKPQELFRGYIESKEELENIINQLNG